MWQPCVSIKEYEDRRLRVYIRTRSEMLRNKYKKLFKSEGESRALETLKWELYGLRESMRSASPGGTAEYALLLGMITECLARKRGLLTRREREQQEEICNFVDGDIIVFEENYCRSHYTIQEVRIAEEMRSLILTMYPKLLETRPA